MLQLNKKTIKIAELMSNLSREEWAKALGLTKGSYKSNIGHNKFTLKQILIMQNLTNLPIELFFEQK